MRASILAAVGVLVAGCAGAPRQPAVTSSPRPAEVGPVYAPTPRKPENAWLVRTERQAIEIVTACEGYKRYASELVAPATFVVTETPSAESPSWRVLVGEDAGDRIATIDGCDVDARTGDVDCGNRLVCP